MAKKVEEEKLVFNDARYAMDIKKDAEESLEKCQNGLKSVLIAQAAFFATVLTPVIGAIDPTGAIVFIYWLACFIAGIVLSIIAFNKCGGLKKVWESVSKITKKVAKLGWLIMPFPMDIATGIILMIVGYIYIPIFCLFFPILTYIIIKSHLKKQIKEANEYLKYCDPVYTDEE